MQTFHARKTAALAVVLFSIAILGACKKDVKEEARSISKNAA